MTPSQIRSFWLKLEPRLVVEELGVCWEYPVNHDKAGYGRHRAPGIREIYAHRLAFQLIWGEITSGELVLHRCDNPRCCNPLHLWSGTTQENQREAMERNRKRNKHSKPDRKPVTRELIQEFLRLRAEGLGYKVIAERFDVPYSTVYEGVNAERYITLRESQ